MGFLGGGVFAIDSSYFSYNFYCSFHPSITHSLIHSLPPSLNQSIINQSTTPSFRFFIYPFPVLTFINIVNRGFTDALYNSARKKHQDDQEFVDYEKVWMETDFVDLFLEF